MKLAVALIGLVLVGCGLPGADGKNGDPGKEGTGGKPGTNGTNGTSGKDGINGTSGKDGINGTSGKDGIDNKITSSISCYGDLSTFSPGQRTLNGKTLGGDLSVAYVVAETASRDVFASATSSWAGSSVSGTEFYSPLQAGALNAPVLLGWDVLGADNFGYWSISLNRVTKIMTVRYTDSDFAMAPNYIELSFPAYACTKNL